MRSVEFGAVGVFALVAGCADLSSEPPARGDASAGETGDAAPDGGPAPAEDSSGFPDRSSGAGSEGSAISDSRSDSLTIDSSSASDAPSESSITDPGTEGDGDRTIGPGFTAAPETMTHAGVPKGAVISFMLPPGKIFPMAPTRQVMVYVPTQYVAGTSAPCSYRQCSTI